MKFVVYGNESERRLGLLEGERVLDLVEAGHAHAPWLAGRHPQFQVALSSLLSLIEAGDAGLECVRALADKVRGSDQPGLFSALTDVRLQAPWPGQRLVLAGANNAQHIADCFTNMGSPSTAKTIHDKFRGGPPSAFWAIARPVMGPGARIEIPARAAGLFDYEGEPAIILGKRGKDIKADAFDTYVWGATMVIDWSVREEAWPPKPADPLVRVKNFDCSKSIGPCVVVDEVNPNELQIETRVNGEVRQDFNMRDMIFTFGEVLEYLSQDLTFFPGDVLSGGTGAGTAMDKIVPNADGRWPLNLFLKAGDTVEVRSPAIGSLVGNVVSKL